MHLYYYLVNDNEPYLDLSNCCLFCVKDIEQLCLLLYLLFWNEKINNCVCLCVCDWNKYAGLFSKLSSMANLQKLTFYKYILHCLGLQYISLNRYYFTASKVPSSFDTLTSMLNERNRINVGTFLPVSLGLMNKTDLCKDNNKLVLLYWILCGLRGFGWIAMWQ